MTLISFMVKIMFHTSLYFAPLLPRYTWWKVISDVHSWATECSACWTFQYFNMCNFKLSPLFTSYFIPGVFVVVDTSQLMELILTRHPCGHRVSICLFTRRTPAYVHQSWLTKQTPPKTNKSTMSVSPTMHSVSTTSAQWRSLQMPFSSCFVQFWPIIKGRQMISNASKSFIRVTSREVPGQILCGVSY